MNYDEMISIVLYGADALKQQQGQMTSEQEIWWRTGLEELKEWLISEIEDMAEADTFELSPEQRAQLERIEDD